MIGNLLYLTDVHEGDAIPSFEETITILEMVRYAASTWDISRAHFEQEYVKSKGLPDIFVDGQMLGGYMCRLIGEWAGDPYAVRKLSVHYREMLFANETIVCYGKVTRVYQEDGLGLAECEITISKKEDDRIAAVGSATVKLPDRP